MIQSKFDEYYLSLITVIDFVLVAQYSSGDWGLQEDMGLR